MPYLGVNSPALIHNNPFLAAVSTTPIYTTTGDPSYSAPLGVQIIIKSLDKMTTYYTFDSFDPPADNKMIYCSVNLSLSHHGNFELQIDDADKTLDTANIRNAARVYISLGKASDRMFTHLSGMIRQTGYTRGCENNLLYNISGFGSAIRFNERILDVNFDSPKTLDGTTVDVTDPDFKANKIVDDALDRTAYYPNHISSSQVEGTGGYEYIDSTGTVVDSTITDFIPGVVSRFGEMQNLFNQLESYTGGRVYVDNSDKIQFQPHKTPVTIARFNQGFRITTNPNLDGDDADNTIYVNADDYTFHDSISKDAGYGNSIYGILPATPAVNPDDVTDTGLFYENKTVEVALRFRPITQPNYRFYAGVEAIGMNNTQNENTVRTRWRICEDDNGIPKDVGGILENRYMYHNKHYNTADGGLQLIQTSKDNPSEDLDENTYYWMILSSVNATATEYWRWYYDDTLRAKTATAPASTSSETDGGSGWTVRDGIRMIFQQGRFKSEPFNCLDVLGVRKNILIESMVPSFPQQIQTKQGAIKYMLGLIHFMGRPRRVFDFSNVTIPNRPIFPGDIACIEDARFNFSTGGNRVVTGQITDVNHSMGIKGGGLSTQSVGQLEMQLSVVAFPQGY